MKQINVEELLSYIDERIDVHAKHMEQAKLNEEYGESYGATRALEDIKAYIEKRMGGREDRRQEVAANGLRDYGWYGGKDWNRGR